MGCPVRPPEPIFHRFWVPRGVVAGSIWQATASRLAKTAISLSTQRASLVLHRSAIPCFTCLVLLQRSAISRFTCLVLNSCLPCRDWTRHASRTSATTHKHRAAMHQQRMARSMDVYCHGPATSWCVSADVLHVCLAAHRHRVGVLHADLQGTCLQSSTIFCNLLSPMPRKDQALSRTSTELVDVS